MRLQSGFLIISVNLDTHYGFTNNRSCFCDFNTNSNRVCPAWCVLTILKTTLLLEHNFLLPAGALPRLSFGTVWLFDQVEMSVAVIADITVLPFLWGPEEQLPVCLYPAGQFPGRTEQLRNARSRGGFPPLRPLLVACAPAPTNQPLWKAPNGRFPMDHQAKLKPSCRMLCNPAFF